MSFCPPIEQLGALIRGELGEPESGEIEEHLEECDHCRGRVSALSEWAFSAAEPGLFPMESVGLRSRALLDQLAQRRAATGADSPNVGERFARAGTPGHELPPELPGFRLIPAGGTRQPERSRRNSSGNSEVGLSRHAPASGWERTVRWCRRKPAEAR
jgi:hypothetical protein